MPGSRRWPRAAGAAVGLTAATSVAAMAARASLSSSAPVDAASARAPVTALGVLLLGAGIVALAVGAGMYLPRHRRARADKPELAPEPLQVTWLSKLAAMVLPLVLGAALVAAALLGVRTVQRAPRFGGEDLGRATAAQPTGRATGSGFAVPAWLPWIALAVGVVAVAAALTFVLARRRQRGDPEPSDRIAARQAIGAAIGALDAATDPRAAVIAAYAAMEAALAASGVIRSPAEAPREYLRRVLVASSATEREAGTLTGLFEEARFSAHPIPDRVRVHALSALSSLRARLQAGGPG
jgi:Domain of unknown function (DUF4129)